MTDVFISYADDDARRVRRIVDGFQAAGVAVFFERESREGVLWMDATAAQIKQSDAVVVVLSKEAAQSERMAWEVDLAARYGKRLFPAVIEADAPIPKAFSEAVERQREVFDDPNGARSVRVSAPMPLWRDEETAPLSAKDAPTPSRPADPVLRATDEAAAKSDPTNEAKDASGDEKRRTVADDALADDLASPRAAAAETAPATAQNGAARTLDGEKIRRLVAEVRRSSDAARAAADGPRTTEGLAKSASLVFAQWRAVEDAEDVRRLKTFREEFADDPYFAERASDRIDLLRREAIWSRADFAFRLVTGMALVAAAVWALRESDQLDEVYSTFAGDSRPAVTAAADGAQSDAELRIMQLQSQVRLERQKAAELQAMLDEDDPDLARLQSALTDAEARAAEIDVELAAARSESIAERARADRASRELEQARIAAAGAAAARDAAEAERDAALREREEAAAAAAGSSASDDLDERLEAIRRQRDRLRNELGGAREQISDLEQALDEADRDRARLAARIAELENALRNAGQTAGAAPAGGIVASDGASVLLAQFMADQEFIYARRRQTQGPSARFPVMNRRDIFRMQACIEQETDYVVGVDGVWGLRTSRAVLGMTKAEAEIVAECFSVQN